MQNNLIHKEGKIKANALKLANFSFLFLVFIFLISFSSADMQVGLDGSLNEIGINFDRTPFNISAQAVNSSYWWDTLDRGPLRSVSDILSSWITNDLFVERTGDTMQGDLDFDGNDINDVGNLEVLENASVGDKFEVGGNVEIADRLAVGILLNETSTVINPGDAVFGGNIFISNGSFFAFPNKWGFSAAFFNNDADSSENTRIFLNFSGTFNGTTGLFCDTLNSPFSVSDKRNQIGTLFSAELGAQQIPLFINTIINSSCVITGLNIFGNDIPPDLSSIAYAVTPQPVFGVTDNDLVVNGIRMFYETNESLFTFGTYTRQNTLQDKPGGPLFSDAFTSTDGDLEYAFSTQTGLNNSASFIRNSFCVLSTRNLTTLQKSNLTYLHNCRQRLIDIGYENVLSFDSFGVGADFAVENIMWAPRIKQVNDLGNGFLEGAGSFTYSIENTSEATFSGGSVRNLIPVSYVTGFEPGDSFGIFSEFFISDLGIFSNDQSDLGNWDAISAPTLCDEGLCAMGSGAGLGDVSMTTTISTLNVNETELSFVYSLFNLIGSGLFSVTISNSTDSEILFSDGTDNIVTSTESILLSEDWSNLTAVNLTFQCDVASAAKPTRQCYVDTIIMNGTFTANTTATVNSFDAEFCGSPTRGTDGRCTNSIYFAAENNTWFASPSINGTGSSGGVFSGSGTANSITKFLAPTVLGDSNIVDNGTLISLLTQTLFGGDIDGGGNDILNVTNIGSEANRIANLWGVDANFSGIVNAGEVQVDNININGDEITGNGAIEGDGRIMRIGNGGDTSIYLYSVLEAEEESHVLIDTAREEGGGSPFQITSSSEGERYGGMTGGRGGWYFNSYSEGGSRDAFTFFDIGEGTGIHTLWNATTEGNIMLLDTEGNLFVLGDVDADSFSEHSLAIEISPDKKALDYFTTSWDERSFLVNGSRVYNHTNKDDIDLLYKIENITECDYEIKINKKGEEVERPINCSVVGYKETKSLSVLAELQRDATYELKTEIEDLETENQRIKDCTSSSIDFPEYKICIAEIGGVDSS